MRRLWLLFAQTATVGLALWFIVTTLKPEWVRQGFNSSRNLSFSSTATVKESNKVLPITQSSYRNAAQRSMPAVVNIGTSKDESASAHPLQNDPFFKKFFGDQLPQKSERPASSGSGVIVSVEGHIITNYHVIEGADGIDVGLADGRKAKAVVIGTDPETDLAVLQINLKDLPAITLGHSENAGVGDVVLAIGNPFGVGQTVTMGIISAMGRNSVGINTYENFIQTDAAVNPGNSGGALVDIDGNLLGINSAIYSRNGGSLGIGFAIPVSTIKSVMEEIITKGEVVRGWIGVDPQDITPEMAESFNIKQASGAIIAGVVRNGPAFQAGIKPGDILTHIGNDPILNRTDMFYQIAKLKPNAKVPFKLMRQGKELSVDVVVGKREQPKPEK